MTGEPVSESRKIEMDNIEENKQTINRKQNEKPETNY
jgi:hypothetical protein